MIARNKKDTKMNSVLGRNESFRPPTSQLGMVMIEVLITVFISTIGLLGIASLQTISLKGSIDSSQRTAAALLVNDVIDRIRANPTGRNADDYNGAFDGYAACVSGEAPPANICSDYYDQGAGAVVNSGVCTGTQLAEFDAWELACGYENSSNNLSSSVNFLTSPVISVVCTDSDDLDGLACSDNSTHDVSVTWTAAAKSVDRNDGFETRSVTMSVGI